MHNLGMHVSSGLFSRGPFSVSREETPFLGIALTMQKGGRGRGRGTPSVPAMDSDSVATVDGPEAVDGLSLIQIQRVVTRDSPRKSRTARVGSRA